MDAQALYDELKKRILNGNLSAGDRLGEIALATRYDVSRLYVKSALQKLRDCLAGGDREGLETMFRLSTVRRAAFDKKRKNACRI